jgi:arginase family enzyme
LISFSPDIADPAFAPAVDDPISDGFSSFEVVNLLTHILNKIVPKQFDMVGISPIYDEGYITQAFAVDIINLFITSIAGRLED